MASSDRFVLPTNCTPRCRAIVKHFASRLAGELCFRRNSEPAVVTTPFMSIRSFTASRNFLLLFDGGQYSINAWSGVALCGRAFGTAHPLSQLTKKSAGRTSRASMHPRVAVQKSWLSRLDMIAPTKQLSANHANEKAAEDFEDGPTGHLVRALRSSYLY